MVEQLNIYGAPIGAFGRTLARNSDPDTSRLAAAAVTPGVPALEAAILAEACLSPLSAFTIAERVEEREPGRWDQGSIRTRVSSLGKRGKLVKSEEKGTSPRGRVVDTWILP